MAYVIFSFIFFFQAEDGIRDSSVTGVQTCALPICDITIGRVMSRTVLWLMAAGAIVFAAAVGVAWHGKLSDQAILDQSARPGSNTASAAAPSQPSSPQSQGPAGEAAPPKAPPPGLAVPSVDVARIGPAGRAVLAGRAEIGRPRDVDPRLRRKRPRHGHGKGHARRRGARLHR